MRMALFVFLTTCTITQVSREASQVARVLYHSQQCAQYTAHTYVMLWQGHGKNRCHVIHVTAHKFSVHRLYSGFCERTYLYLIRPVFCYELVYRNIIIKIW